MSNGPPSGSRYYDRSGRAITLLQWAELHTDRDYVILAQEMINDRWFVSTVWLGLDHGFSFLGDRILIFETMVFDHGSDVHGLDRGHDWEMHRYTTEAEARQGHADMVQLVNELEDIAMTTPKEGAPDCCCCGNPCEPWPGSYPPAGYGHNPEPVVDWPARACDDCNTTIIIPARLRLMGGGRN